MARFDKYHKHSVPDNFAEKIFNFPVLYRFKLNTVKFFAGCISPIWFQNKFDPFQILATQISGNSILELGCGDGDLYSKLKKMAVTMEYLGSDINPNMVHHCKSKYPESKWLTLKELPYPFEDKQFDTVIIWNVMHHLNSYVDIMNLLSESLRVGQRTIFFEPAQSNLVLLKNIKLLWWKITDGGKYYFTYTKWHEIFADLGAEIKWEKISEPLNQIYMVEINKPSIG